MADSSLHCRRTDTVSFETSKHRLSHSLTVCPLLPRSEPQSALASSLSSASAGRIVYLCNKADTSERDEKANRSVRGDAGFEARWEKRRGPPKQHKQARYEKAISLQDTKVILLPADLPIHSRQCLQALLGIHLLPLLATECDCQRSGCLTLLVCVS